MKEAVSDLIKKVRIAIDEITKGNNDDFVTDADTEIQNAIETSANQILLEAPVGFLKPVPVSVGNNNDYDAAQTKYTDGHGSVVVPDDFLKIFEFRLNSWQSSIRELMNPGSQEVKMQASPWSHGTPQKPKAMMTTDSNGNRILMYWTAGEHQDNGAVGEVYDHTIDTFTYLPKASIINVTGSDGTTIVPTLDAALIDAAEKNIVYRAAGIFLEGKKEKDLADRLYQLADKY